MNRTQQQSYYYQAALPPRNRPYDLPPRRGPQLATSNHVYQAGPGSQRVMSPQRMPFAGSGQGLPVLMPGQYRLPLSYFATPQQYSVGTRTPFFHSGTGPTENGSYARAYNPARPHFTPSVQAAPVMNCARCTAQRRRPRHKKRKPKLKDVAVQTEPEPAPVPEPQCSDVSPPAPEETEPSREDKEEVVVPEEPEPAPVPEPQCSDVSPPAPEETEPSREDKEDVVVPEEPEPAPVPEPQCSDVSPPAPEETEPSREDKEEVVVPEEPEPAPVPEPQCSDFSPPAPEETEPSREDKEEVVVPEEPEAAPVQEPQCSDVSPPAPEETEPSREDKEEVVVPEEPEPAPVQEPQCPEVSPALEEMDLTTEDNEEKLDAEITRPESPQSSTTNNNYQYKKEDPVEPQKKKKYDRDFVLRPQWHPASTIKPKELPDITFVVPDEVNNTRLKQFDQSRLPEMNCVHDFLPSFAKMEQPGMEEGGRRPLRDMRMNMADLQSSQQVQRTEPKKVIPSLSFNNDIELNKVENAWKPSAVKTRNHVVATVADVEDLKTKELFRQVHSILNKLTPEKFERLMTQMLALTIDTEERLRGVTDIIFEKAISEPKFSMTYANMCQRLAKLEVQVKDNSKAKLNFHMLLLTRCQEEFEKDKDANELIEKEKEVEAASGDEEKQLLRVELRNAKDKARTRSLGNIKFVGELFVVKMLIKVIMHDCVVKLLKKHDDESLECLCKLLSTIGKDFDSEEDKPQVDHYFHQMEKIIKEKKNSSRICFLLQDVLELRQNNWVPRRPDNGPKTIGQIHREAELEDQMEQMNTQQTFISRNEPGRGRGQMGWGQRGVYRGRHNQGSGCFPQNGPRHKDTRGNDNAKPAKFVVGTQNRFSVLDQLHSTMDSDRKDPQKNNWNREDHHRFDHQARGGGKYTKQWDDRDRNGLPVTASFSRKNEKPNREKERHVAANPVRQVVNMTVDRGSREQARSKESDLLQ